MKKNMLIKMNPKIRIRPEKCKHRYNSAHLTLCHLLDDKENIYDKQCRFFNCKLIKNGEKSNVSSKNL